MHEQSEFGNLINRYLFDPIARSMGFHVGAEHHAVPDHIVMALVVALILLSFAAWLRGKLSVENPTPMQHLMEVILDAIRGLMKEVIGKDVTRYVPLIGALAFYIFLGNVIGQVPGFLSPTSNLNITASCAICVFIYYNYHGIRKHGLLKYLKHFAGPVWWLAWLLFPIEIVSHCARPFSLSMRLFGNIFAEELIISSLNNYLFPFLAALPVMLLGLFASTIQAFIFILLTMVYISGAVEEGHDEGHDKAHGDKPEQVQAQPVAA
jgi:F-type H+-transporting ATPase subunit a